MTNPRAAMSADSIRALGFAYQTSRTLLSAVELGLFSVLAEAPLDPDGLTRRLGLHPRAARDFFDSLVALGMLQRESELYANTPETDWFLDRAKPSYIGGLYESAATVQYRTWGRLTNALRTGEPQSPETQSAAGRWTERYKTPAGVQRSARTFIGSSRDAMQAIARQFPWDRYATFIDIGTSAGDLPVQVALAHAHITGGGFDLPPVAVAFEEHVASFGLADRLHFFAGDFFTDEFPPADVLALSSVLHNWKLETRQMLLEKAHAALPRGGALIVKDSIIDDDRRQNVGALVGSLNMILNGPESSNFTGAECRGWMDAAGFRDVYMEPLTDAFSMVVGFK